MVAYYCPEPISRRAESIVRGKGPVHVSDLTEIEFLAALSRKLRTGEVTADAATAIRNYFATHLEEGVFRRVRLGPHHLRSALELMSKLTTPLRTLDAFHLAIAAFDNFQLVTADETLALAAKEFSIRTTYLAAASRRRGS